ncbi:hypothetical protein F4553_001780 [Allocatelliglobosispora scoriae]|uniref:LTD domain-containing protein n=1 Tax=Allocatelliglobosispora scoriae TaxID=643052 RepID=A0A841BNK5_9ACTN|nr:lamin tail domain-containing protein [Allocatelliglobosispora scoriae]MBB5868401.1 hypothetical protein [Allocatelliglobosispora scoriae]
MRRIATVAALAFCAALLPATAAHAANPAVMIVKVYANSPGADTGSNASLNGEYITLKNTTAATINLYRWTIRDKANHVYTFTGNFNLLPGRFISVHTGSGTNTGGNRFWGLGGYVWNNAGDTAYLRTPSGANFDTCTWGAVASYKLC